MFVMLRDVKLQYGILDLPDPSWFPEDRFAAQCFVAYTLDLMHFNSITVPVEDMGPETVRRLLANRPVY